MASHGGLSRRNNHQPVTIATQSAVCRPRGGRGRQARQRTRATGHGTHCPGPGAGESGALCRGRQRLPDRAHGRTLRPLASTRPPRAPPRAVTGALLLRIKLLYPSPPVVLFPTGHIHMRGAGLALLVLTAVALQAEGLAQAPVRVLLQGRVIERGSGNPIANARLVAAKVGGTVEDYRTATSDSSGRFVVRDLTPGSYRVHADAAGYLRSEHGRTPVAPAGTPLVLTERGAAPEALVMLTPTGVIAGRVTDRGRPARNVWVRALKATYRDGQRFLSVEEYGVTDDRGEYRLFGLTPGSYFISAIPAGRPRLDGDALVTQVIPSNANGNRSEIRSPATIDSITAAALETGVSPAVYYPNTMDSATATAVEIAPGATVLAIDLAVTRTPTFHVRGRINTMGLAGTPRVRVSVFAAESGTAPSIPGIEVPAGDFDLPGIPPGRYQLAVHAMSSKPSVQARVPIEVWDRDLDGVVALLQPGVTVSGRVLIDGAPPPAGQQPLIQLIGMNGMPGSGAKRLDAEGTFTIDNVAIGDYRWRLIPFGGGLRNPPWAKTATFGSDDVSKRFVNVGADAA